MKGSEARRVVRDPLRLQNHAGRGLCLGGKVMSQLPEFLRTGAGLVRRSADNRKEGKG